MNVVSVAMDCGLVPRDGPLRAMGLNETDLVITIYPDDRGFREVLNRLLPEDAYRVEVQNIQATAT